MTKPVPIALVVLVVLSLPVMAVGVGGSTDNGETVVHTESATVDGDHLQLNDTPNRLVAGEDPHSSYATPTPDLGQTLAAEDAAVRSSLETFAFEERFDDLDEEERRQALEAALERVDERIDGLHESEKAVVAEHAAGETTDQELLDELARNYRAALELEKTVDRLDELADEVDNVTVSTRDYGAELESHLGPIRERINDGVTDTSSDIDGITLQTTDTGLVTAAVDGEQYIREAVRYDYRDRHESEQYAEPIHVYDAGQDAYPWAFENSRSASVSSYHTSNLYKVTVDHPQGTTSIVFDSGTERIYAERQTLDLDSLSTDTEQHLEGDNLTATIEMTSADGPMKVTAIDANTGEPVDASIAVDDTWVGKTDSNGERWIAPPADDFELTIADEDDVIEVSAVVE